MQKLQLPFARLGRFSVMLIAVAAIFAGGLGLGTGLSSTGAQSGGEIRGCVSMYTGTVRIVSESGQCTQHERPLNWNQQGPSGLVDIQIVEHRETVTTDDETNRASVIVECPSGYQVIGGGAGFGGASAVEPFAFAMSSSGPFEAGQLNRDNDGWRGTFITIDGEDADGSYLFVAEAICALTS